MSAPVPALELRGIEKRFGAVHANRGVSLAVAPASIHGLIGENGAGKSTLMNVLYGFHAPDAGEILVRGRRTEIGRPADAIAAGSGMAPQHFTRVDAFRALETVLLGAEGGARLSAGRKRARAELERLEREYGLEVPPPGRAGDLPLGVQQRVEILKALCRGADILILDEPTAVLTPQEADRLFGLLLRLREQGKSVILVTHKLREIMAVTDRVTVMRQGAVVHETATAATSAQALAEQMVGRAVSLKVAKGPARTGPVLLRVRDLEVRDRRGVLRVKGVGFDLRAGEIVGLAGVAGNGQYELLEALAGIRPPSRGEIRLGSAQAGADPRRCRQLGLAHVPEDRLRLGTVPRFPAEDNAILGYHDDPAWQRGWMLDRAAIRAGCERKMAAYDVRPPEPRLRR